MCNRQRVYPSCDLPPPSILRHGLTHPLSLPCPPQVSPSGVPPKYPSHAPPPQVSLTCRLRANPATATAMSKPGGGNMTDRESNPRPLGCMSGDSTTRLERSAVISGTGIHRLIYRDICVERGASYAACCSQQATRRSRCDKAKIYMGVGPIHIMYIINTETFRYL